LCEAIVSQTATRASPISSPKMPPFCIVCRLHSHRTPFNWCSYNLPATRPASLNSPLSPRTIGAATVLAAPLADPLSEPSFPSSAELSTGRGVKAAVATLLTLGVGLEAGVGTLWWGAAASLVPFSGMAVLKAKPSTSLESLLDQSAG